MGRIEDSIYHVIFDVVNLQSIDFIVSTDKSTMISNLFHCKADITLFTFLSSVNAVKVGQRYPSKILSLDLLLRFLYIISSSCPTSNPSFLPQFAHLYPHLYPCHLLLLQFIRELYR